MSVNTKKTLRKLATLGLVMGLSVTTLSNGVDSMVKANETKPAISAVTEDAAKVDVIERDGKFYVVVTPSKDIRNLVLNVTVDGVKYDKINLPNLVKGEVKEVEIELPKNDIEDKAKTKRLPNTSAVTTHVAFDKVVKDHTFKGTLTFTYDEDGNVVKPDEGKKPDEGTKPTTPTVTHVVAGTGEVIATSKTDLDKKSGVFEFNGKKYYYNSTETGDGFIKHIYKEVEEKLPSDAPTTPKDELKVTRSVDMDGTELSVEEGVVEAKTGVVKFNDKEYTYEKTETKDGITTHFYKVVEHQVPGDAPSVPAEELKVTRSVDLGGNELLVEEGVQEHKTGEVEFNSKKYTFVRTETKEGLTTHYYKEVVEFEIPKDAPSVPMEELKVTRSVDMDGTELSVEEGTIEAKKGLVKFGDKEYTYEKTETKDGITTHYYKAFEFKVPSDAPSVPMEELKVTRSVDMDGVELLVEEGTQEHKVGEVDFGGNKYTYEKTETKDGITTHFYKKVVAQDPEFSGIDAGLPKNAKWTRTQLQKWGFGIGKITGDYKVDGDLGAFDTEDELDKAFKKGKEALNRAHHDGAISEEVYNNAPKTMLNEVDPGPAGYKGNLYDANQLGNDGNPMPDLDDEE